MRWMLLAAAIPALWGQTAEVRGDRLIFRFVASEWANLTFQLDAMSGLSQADGKAFRSLWERELRWGREDDRQLDRWKSFRLRQLNAEPERGAAEPPGVAWPPNYASYYGAELGLDQAARIAGFQARSIKDYRRRLGRVVEEREADGLASVVKHFGPRFHEYWEREGGGAARPKAEAFAALVRSAGILELAETLAQFTEADLPKRHEVWFYVMAHPARYGRNTMATQVQNHAPVEMLDGEQPAQKLGVIVHELVHHFYDRAPQARQLALLEEFRRSGRPWKMSAYSYLNEAVATAAGILVERRLRNDADFVEWSAKPRNVYGQPWIAALGMATYPILERRLPDGKGLFAGFAEPYLAAVGESLGGRTNHPHFRMASRVVVFRNGTLRGANRLFRERVPSIMHATGWDQLARFPELPVVALAIDGEQESLLARIGPGRDVTVIMGETAAAVEEAVERFAMRP
ncbi:MAG TPA: hypothetical protein VFQ91_28450 [Bryobacteraceae bacterium]|nr:hypothetical protein [Bryobacteraceae bacterium]